MAKKIAIHSFRGGTGKTSLSANVGVALALEGLRVAVMDTDIHSPGLHALFDLDAEALPTLNDYIWGRCEIHEVAHEVTDALGEDVPGQLFLVPCSINPGEVARIFRDENYDISRIAHAQEELIEALNLDVLVIDTHPGINDETLLDMAIADTVGLLLRPDYQDYQGTSVSLEIARRLEIPRILLIVNKSPLLFDAEIVRQKIYQAFDHEVLAVLPYSEEMATLASRGVFVLEHPAHPLSQQFRHIAKHLVE